MIFLYSIISRIPVFEFPVNMSQRKRNRSAAKKWTACVLHMKELFGSTQLKHLVLFVVWLSTCLSMSVLEKTGVFFLHRGRGAFCITFRGFVTLWPKVTTLVIEFDGQSFSLFNDCGDINANAQVDRRWLHWRIRSKF